MISCVINLFDHIPSYYNILYGRRGTDGRRGRWRPSWTEQRCGGHTSRGRYCIVLSYITLSLYIHIYIYIYREREIYIYIYIYISRPRPERRRRRGEKQKKLGRKGGERSVPGEIPEPATAWSTNNRESKQYHSMTPPKPNQEELLPCVLVK